MALAQSDQPITQAMLLAAGRGLRFRPITDHMPKPLVKLAGKALIDWQLEALERQGITKLVINGCYLREMLWEHISQRKSPMEIICVDEDSALETGGGIKHALEHFEGQPFFAINADVVLWPAESEPLTQLQAAFHKQPQLKLALLLHPKPGAIGLSSAGDFFCNEYGMLRRRSASEEAPYYYTGVQLMKPEIFDGIEDTIFSMNLIYDRLLKDYGEQVISIAGIIHDQGGYMLHVGDPQAHRACEAFIAEQAVEAHAASDSAAMATS